ncbi:hypothetical protein SmJEL517_g00084 [Synchytrium microbalum]|uniref:Uncharacterized protein n=1 Tax=Synchytrium microbalum TaxID=1806994 RepID=A0A507CAI8_9FUNG|nr:uncharacterized protein SmJEL517_g00084 [Synchytrium microbalum]TPX38067.1 hypothetical protein SmJEL517_g00084 [Synchytrium microbalum]
MPTTVVKPNGVPTTSASVAAPSSQQQIPLPKPNRTVPQLVPTVNQQMVPTSSGVVSETSPGSSSAVAYIMPQNYPQMPTSQNEYQQQYASTPMGPPMGAEYQQQYATTPMGAQIASRAPIGAPSYPMQPAYAGDPIAYYSELQRQASQYQYIPIPLPEAYSADAGNRSSILSTAPVGAIQPGGVIQPGPMPMSSYTLRNDPWKLRVGQLEAELRRARDEIDEKTAMLDSLQTHTHESIVRDADQQETIDTLRRELTTAMLEFARESSEMRERTRAAETNKGDPVIVRTLEAKVVELERKLSESRRATLSRADQIGFDTIEDLQAKVVDLEGVLSITQEELSNSIHLKEAYDRNAMGQAIRIRQLEERCNLLQNLCKQIEDRAQDADMNRMRANAQQALDAASPAPITDKSHLDLDSAIVALTAAEARIAVLDEEVSKLTTKSQEHELAHLTANHELEELRNIYESEKVINARHIQDLESTKSSKAYDLRIKQHTDEAVRLQGRLDRLESDLKRSVDELQRVQDENSILSNGFNATKSELDMLKSLMTKTPASALSEGEVSLLRSDNARLRKHKIDLEQHSQQAFQVYNEMVALIEERDGQIENLESILDSYQKSGFTLEDGGTIDASATERIISELADSRSKLTSLEAQNSVLHSMLSQQRTQMTDEIRKLRVDLDVAERAASEANARLSSRTLNGSQAAASQEQENIIANLRIALQNKTEDFRELKQMMDQLTEELSSREKNMTEMQRRYSTLQKRNIELLERGPGARVERGPGGMAGERGK